MQKSINLKLQQTAEYCKMAIMNKGNTESVERVEKIPQAHTQDYTEAA